MNQDKFEVIRVDWKQNREALRTVRESVFIIEQQVPRELEWDSGDAESIHVLARDLSGKPIGTGRITREGQIGRMAVLKPWRDKGVGSALLSKLMQVATQEIPGGVFLNAQESAIPFYRNHGFQVVGERFFEAGIPHRRMHLDASTLDTD